MAIEFKNNTKPGLPMPSKSKTKKGKKNGNKKQQFSFIPPYLNKKRPISAAKQKSQPISSDWN